MGLVTKNAILLIDRAIVRVRDHGETPVRGHPGGGPAAPAPHPDDQRRHGARHAADRDLATARAASSARPMAIAVIGGVISSTLLSLVVVPVFYLAIENVKGHWRLAGSGRWLRPPHAPSAVQRIPAPDCATRTPPSEHPMKPACSLRRLVASPACSDFSACSGPRRQRPAPRPPRPRPRSAARPRTAKRRCAAAAGAGRAHLRPRSPGGRWPPAARCRPAGQRRGGQGQGGPGHRRLLAAS